MSLINSRSDDFQNATAPMIKIRKASSGDIPQLEQLFLEVRQDTFTWENPNKFKLEDFQKSTEGEIVFVAEENMEIVGFISIWAQDNFIHNLFIRHDRQNEGIGKLLLNKAIEEFSPPLHLKVITYNTKACHFYEKQGWEKLSTHEDATEPYHLYKYNGYNKEKMENQNLKQNATDCNHSVPLLSRTSEWD